MATSYKVNGIRIGDAVFESVKLESAGAGVFPVGAVLAIDSTSGNFVRFNPAGADGAEIAKAVLTAEVEFTGAGVKSERVAISGKFRVNDLVDSTGTALTPLAIEQLRDYTILALKTSELSYADN